MNRQIPFSMPLILTVAFAWMCADWVDAQDAGGKQALKTYRIERRIEAPAGFIYPYLIEEDKIARWKEDRMMEVTFPRGLEPRVGKQIKVTVKIPTHPWMLMEIVRLDADREVLVEFIDGVLDGIFLYRLVPEQEGGTLLVHEMAIEPVGAFITVYWELYGRYMHRRKMKKFMARIEKIVEADYKKMAVGESSSAVRSDADDPASQVQEK